MHKNSVHVHYDKISENKKSFVFLLLDFFMIGLVVLSLLWMILDWHFTMEYTRSIIQSISPRFYTWYYTQIHPEYFRYDSYFVLVFITEILVRWTISIFQKKYARWWFYPFIHWYDVLGCVPIGSFRVLRFIRIYGMLIRLDRKGFIDIKRTAIYRLFKRNMDILVEEVSDKIVDNVLAGIQAEIYNDDNSLEKIITNVIQPRQEELVKWIANKVQVTNHLFYERFNKDIELYLKKNIQLAVHNNEEIKQIDKIPLLGKQITETLEHSISDITFNVINNTIKDLAEFSREKEINEVATILFQSVLAQEEQDKRLQMVIKTMVSESIDVLREQVAKKQWKIKEEI